MAPVVNQRKADTGSESGIGPRRPTDSSPQHLVDEIRQRLGTNSRLRRSIPHDGRLRIDRVLPFLCVYRKPPDRDDVGTVELVTTEASYLFARGESELPADLVAICQTVRDAALQRFSAFVLFEIWAQKLEPATSDAQSPLLPSFEIHASGSPAVESTICTLEKALQRIRLSGFQASVKRHDIGGTDGCAPPGMRPLLRGDSKQPGVFSIGLAVHPIYRSTSGDVLFPLVLQRLRSQLAIAIRKTVYAFTQDVAGKRLSTFHAFGPTALVKATSLVDQQLSDIAHSFDYLLQITPVNAADAWKEFHEGGFRRSPTFHYRPLPQHPSDLKRALYGIPIDRVEDPTLANLFWEKQDELDRQITSLREIDSPKFLYSSLQLYGEIEPELLSLALEWLSATAAPTTSTAGEAGRPAATREYLGCNELVTLAQAEVAYYHEQDENFHATIQPCDTIAAGVMVSKGTVLVDKHIRVCRRRVQALLQHEIGTHLLTYFNGRRQPIQQFFAGLAGCEAFQEGVAVLAEYLVGGLTNLRMRTLAARVIATDMMVRGKSFVETFQRLIDEYSFSQRSAFTIATRIFRAGGTTKDAIYLRAFRDLLRQLDSIDDRQFERIFVGKIAAVHLMAVEDLMTRDLVKPPCLLPRYLHDERARELLKQCRGKSAVELVHLRKT